MFTPLSKKMFLVVFSVALLLAACGEESSTTTVEKIGMDVVDQVSELPPCNDGNRGESFWVKDASAPFVCIDGNWLSSSTIATDGKNTCYSEVLADKSGSKIICNGDSIGVVFNGEKGEQGERGEQGEKGDSGEKGAAGSSGKPGAAGEGCVIVKDEDSEARTDSVTIVCGKDSLRLEVSMNDLISMLTLSGASQKGPFVKGSKVYVYELANGKSLAQTSRTFIGTIQDDNGLFTIPSVSLKSQYALLEANGYYRNEVSGYTSSSPISLFALTDLMDRERANINLLTHLEYHRARHLVLQDGEKIAKARAMAAKDVFAAFNIDNAKFGSPEDLNIFSDGEDNAALLAISVMLQGDLNEGDFSALLTSISTDLAEDGFWDQDSASRAEIADWAANADVADRLASIRQHIEKWKLGQIVPNFEKYMRKFWHQELRLSACDESMHNKVVHVTNPYSIYHSSIYAYSGDSDKKMRFICNGDSGVWRAAKDIEKDTMGLGRDFKDGDVRNGLVNVDFVYTFEEIEGEGVAGRWRHANSQEDITLGLRGCTQKRKDTVGLGSDKEWYKCVNEKWRLAENIEKDTAGWGNDYEPGKVRYGTINTDIVYVFENGVWREGSPVDMYCGRACIASADNDTVKATDGNYYYCTRPEGETKYAWTAVSDLYNDTFEAADKCVAAKDGSIMPGRVNKDIVYVCDVDDANKDGHKGWEFASEIESQLGGCRNNAKMLDSVGLYYGSHCNKYGTCYKRYFVICKVKNSVPGWEEASYASYSTMGLACDRNGDLHESTLSKELMIEFFGEPNEYWNYQEDRFVCEADTFRLATKEEVSAGKGCVEHTENEISLYGTRYSKWRCTKKNEDGMEFYAWTFASDLIEESAFVDARDGKTYTTVALGNQVWMSQNLNYVDSVSTPSLTGKITCNLSQHFQVDEPRQCDDGVIYTWAAAIDSIRLWEEHSLDCGYKKTCGIESLGKVQGICPDGWHLPSQEEFQELLDFSEAVIGVSSNCLGFLDRSYEDWPEATNLLRFNALPTYYGNSNAVYWAFGEGDDYKNANYVFFGHGNYGEGSCGAHADFSKYYAHAVRCVKD